MLAGMLLFAFMNVAIFIVMLLFNHDVLPEPGKLILMALRTSGLVKKIRTKYVSIPKSCG